jgi:hypothetical protein
MLVLINLGRALRHSGAFGITEQGMSYIGVRILKRTPVLYLVSSTSAGSHRYEPPGSIKFFAVPSGADRPSCRAERSVADVTGAPCRYATSANCSTEEIQLVAWFIVYTTQAR